MSVRDVVARRDETVRDAIARDPVLRMLGVRLARADATSFGDYARALTIELQKAGLPVMPHGDLKELVVGMFGAEPSPADVIVELATQDTVAYERTRRDAAEKLGVRASVLDKLVQQARGGAIARAPRVTEDIEPSPDPIPLGDLLNQVADAVACYVVIDRHAADAVALWAAASWMVEVVDCAPVLNVRSPERRCGKTTLLSVLSAVVRRPVSVSTKTFTNKASCGMVGA